MLKRKGNENQSVGTAQNVYTPKAESGFYSPNEAQSQNDYVGVSNNRYQVSSNTQQRQFTYNYPAYSDDPKRSSSEFSRTASTMHRTEVGDSNFVEADDVFDETPIETRRHADRVGSTRRRTHQTAATNVQNAQLAANQGHANLDGDQMRSLYVPPMPAAGYYTLAPNASASANLNTGVVNMVQEPQFVPANYLNGFGMNGMLLPNGISVQNGAAMLPSAAGFGVPLTMRAGAMSLGPTATVPAQMTMGEQVVQNGVSSYSPLATYTNGVPRQTQTQTLMQNGSTMRAGVQTTSTQVTVNASAPTEMQPTVLTGQRPSPNAATSTKVGTGNASRASPEVLRAMPKGPPSGEMFERIRLYCRQNGILYEDPDFPASNESLFNASSDQQAVATYRDAEWLRPGEIVKMRAATTGSTAQEPALFVKGMDRFDLAQGALGNCWVLASIAAFCERKELVQQVIPAGQNFSSEWYAGVFHFRFARLGEWRDVLVDDRLPTRNGQLIFVHSPDSNEFWGSLIEKAYAKLAACYANLDGGRFEDAMLDFTNGLAEDFELAAIRSDAAAARRLESIMLDSFNRDTIMCAGINPPDNTQANVGSVGKNNLITANDLVLGHAYTITNVQSIVYPYVANKPSTNRVCLVRIRNPWGNTEWNGAFSDNGPEWNQVQPAFRRKFNFQSSDGEFWMPLKDFIDNFDRLSLCHLAPDISAASAKLWLVKRFSNHWIKGLSAGGRPVLKETHCTNPQYRVTLNDDGHGHSEQTVLVEIQQPDIRHLQSGASASADLSICYKPVGFVLYRIPPDVTFPLSKDFIRTNEYVARCDSFVTSRSYAKRFTLPLGDYVVVPCTSDANIDSEFLLQVYAEHSCFVKDDYAHGETNIPAETAYTYVDKTPPLSEKQKEAIRTRFIRLAGNENGDLPAHLVPSLLRNIAISELPREFPIELSKSLVHYVSDSKALKMTLKDAYRLVQIVLNWCNMFREFDTDHSTTLDASEMQSLLSRLGYSLDMAIIKQLVLRYCDERGQLDLTNSLFCITKLSSVSKLFATHSNGEATNLSSDVQISFTLKSLLISIALI